MPTRGILLTVLAAFTILAAPAWGQDRPAGAQPAEGSFEALRTRQVLTDEDRQALQAWVSERIQAIVGGMGGEAASQLRAALDGASPAFRDAFVPVMIDQSRQVIPRAPLAGSAQLVALLRGLDSLNTVDILLASLADERAAVRAAAAAGLEDLRPRIVSEGGGLFTRVMEALRDAGRRETSPETLKAIYRAMNYAEGRPAAPDPQLNVAALLDVLSTRSEGYAAGNPTAEGGDVVGLRLAAKLRGRMNEEQRNRYVLALARMLRYTVLRYADELHRVRDRTASPVARAERNNAEILLTEIDSQLTELLTPQPAPSIREALKRETRATDMKIELNKWADVLVAATGQRFHTDAQSP